eukprot:CAMPEP_0178899782 /NCGR_PEP_ID=MMETSP0786-20121207/3098_1 /TAXON_ID=186022 /ORGANISM="Thalassionema frauenfeldii, Strain CCMP 1798" /LENGTH=110 /DNA_ID=CAMNT_0020570691 /DNA_START=65 /DNA_END=397 /DNA_ORIENTATION=-
MMNKISAFSFALLLLAFFSMDVEAAQSAFRKTRTVTTLRKVEEANETWTFAPVEEFPNWTFAPVELETTSAPSLDVEPIIATSKRGISSANLKSTFLASVAAISAVVASL